MPQLLASAEAVQLGNVLIIEDNPDLAYGLRTGLEIEGYAVDVADDGESGLARAKQWLPDLVILDLMLPGMDGYRVLKNLRDNGLEMPVLILTARGEEADKVLGFRLGADDYVTKPCGVLELLARVGALLRRSRMAERALHGGVSAETTERFGSVEINPASRTVTKNAQPVGLSPKEFDLLLTLVRRRGAVASRVELLREVWGHRVEVMTRTVDIHIAELRRKLEDDPSAPRHILTVWKAGYRLEP
jgi:DNA-binding response OmpR family regulator